MIRTNTSWAKILIVLGALTGLGSGADNPDTTWAIQGPINLIMFFIVLIGYSQINSLRQECLEAKKQLEAK